MTAGGRRSRPSAEAAARQAEARREQARAQLEKACDELRRSEGWRRFAKARALLRGYSLNNTLLIFAQSLGSHCLLGEGQAQKVHVGLGIVSSSGITWASPGTLHDVDLVVPRGYVPHGLRRQPRARTSTATAMTTRATPPATSSEAQTGDSWKPVRPARFASTR